MRRLLKRGLYGLVLVLIAPFASADSPREVWVKSKCALCHGLDGSSQTDTGRKTGAPDLRAPRIQKLPDAILIRNISGGHKKMPSFHKQVSPANVRVLAAYIRGLGK